ncbi:hypothetical protein [Paenibacillus sp. FJAT-26967]|uniref:hypothetical protein n=1 Tax=Paenibacillus sp. FJAT-26967 TaxID=1729690 RepID=UPI000838EBF2|nr:hypothetical protein [Paenibacillus sp. FJAT-26967]
MDKQKLIRIFDKQAAQYENKEKIRNKNAGASISYVKQKAMCLNSLWVQAPTSPFIPPESRLRQWSTNPAAAAVQKALNPLLHRAFGCHHTRNIQELIHKSGIKILNAETYWINMVHLIWAKPCP